MLFLAGPCHLHLHTWGSPVRKQEEALCQSSPQGQFRTRAGLAERVR